MSTQTQIPASSSTEQIEKEHGKPSSKTRTLLLGVGALILVIAIGAWLYFRNRVGTDDAEVEGHIEQISPRVSGTVVEVDVLDNQVVHSGQVLFKLDDSDYKVALQRAQAELAQAQAMAEAAQTNVPVTRTSSGSGLSSAQAALLESQAGQQYAAHQIDVAQARLAAAQANVVEAQANAQRAVSDEHRYAQLVAKDEVSQQEYDRVATTAKAAQAQVVAAQAQVQAARQEVDASNANLAVARSKVAEAIAGVHNAATAPQQVAISKARADDAQAQVALAQAKVAQAELDLGYTVARAPTDGQVGNKHVEVGQTFSAGQPALAIVPVNDVYVFANYKETQLHSMHPGQRAEVHVDAFGVTLKGHVESIGAGTGARFSLLPPENATGNYVKVVQRVPVKIVFEPGQDLSRLRPGMSVESTVFMN